MRTLLLIITALISLGFAALAYLAFNGLINITLYILIMSILSICLTFLSGHFIYNYYFQRRNTNKPVK